MQHGGYWFLRRPGVDGGQLVQLNGACFSRWRIFAMHAALAQLYALRLQQNVHWLQMGHQCTRKRWRDFHFLMILQIFVTSRQKKKCVWAAVPKAPVVFFFMVAAHWRLSWHFSFLPLPLLPGFLVLFVLIRAPQSLWPHTHKNAQQKDIGQFASSLFDPHSASHWGSSCARFTKRTSWMIYSAPHSFWVHLSASWCEVSVAARFAE